jgi:hypothetical protein
MRSFRHCWESQNEASAKSASGNFNRVLEMQRLTAIAALTWKAAFRFRLFWVLTVLLLGSVVVLPLLLKDDGTARGFTQILLTYTLGVITTLLGFTTLWLACGTLARDVEECQMQMIAVKPVARWEIWLGKWLGLLMLNTVLLALAGGSVFALLQWRAKRLPEAQQKLLRKEVFVARASLKPPVPDIENEVEQVFQKRIKETPVPANEQPLMRQQLREAVKARDQIVPPGYQRTWTIDGGLQAALLRDQPLFLRVKFYAAKTNSAGSYYGIWQIGSPEKKRVFYKEMNVAADSFAEFEVAPNLFEDDGKLLIRFHNRDSASLLFPLEDGLEVLYREGSFGLNFIRGLGIILSWLALLSALGLAAASFMSFPVAAFFSLSLLIVALSSGTLSGVVDQGGMGGADHETGAVQRSPMDLFVIPFFKGILWVVHLVEGFSPIDSLSSGRSITWGQLGLAGLINVLVLGGLVGGTGMIIFTFRELATAQGNS